MNGLARQSFTVLFGRSVIRVTQFVTFVLLARTMTPAAFGWFGLLTTTITLAVTLGSLGLRQSFTYQIGQQKLTAGGALGTSIFLWPVLTAVSVAVIVLYYRDADTGMGTDDLIAILSAGLAGAMLLTLMQGVFLGRGEISWFSLSESVPRVVLMVTIGVIVIVAGTSVRLPAAMWSYAVSFLAALPLVFWLAIRHAGRLQLCLRQLPGMIRYGLIFAFNLFLITLCTRVSMFVVESQHGAAAAGEYYAAARVNEIFLEIATAIGMVIFSNAARQAHTISIVERNARISCWFLWLFICLAVVVAGVAPWFVSLLAGDQYNAAAPILQVLALGLAPAAASKIIYSTLAGGGRPSFGTPVILASLSVTVGLTYALVPAHGGLGGAIAVVVGQYTLLIGYAAICKIRYRLRIRDFFLPHKRDISRIWSAIVARVPLGSETR